MPRRLKLEAWPSGDCALLYVPASLWNQLLRPPAALGLGTHPQDTAALGST